MKEELKKILVSDIMTRNPITTAPDTSLLECAKKMVKNNVGSLVLVEGKSKKLRGFISEKDILWALIKKSKDDLRKIKAIEISPRKLITTNPKTTMGEAIEKMKKSKFGRLPVVQEGNLVGFITTKDILNFNPNIYPELEELEKIREEETKLQRLKRFNEDGFDSDGEGVCEECGNHSVLYIVKGVSVCGNCRDLIRGE